MNMREITVYVNANRFVKVIGVPELWGGVSRTVLRRLSHAIFV